MIASGSIAIGSAVCLAGCNSCLVAGSKGQSKSKGPIPVVHLVVSFGIFVVDLVGCWISFLYALAYQACCRTCRGRWSVLDICVGGWWLVFRVVIC